MVANASNKHSPSAVQPRACIHCPQDFATQPPARRPAAFSPMPAACGLEPKSGQCQPLHPSAAPGLRYVAHYRSSARLRAEVLSLVAGMNRPRSSYTSLSSSTRSQSARATPARTRSRTALCPLQPTCGERTPPEGIPAVFQYRPPRTANLASPASPRAPEDLPAPQHCGTE